MKAVLSYEALSHIDSTSRCQGAKDAVETESLRYHRQEANRVSIPHNYRYDSLDIDTTDNNYDSLPDPELPGLGFRV